MSKGTQGCCEIPTNISKNHLKINFKYLKKIPTSPDFLKLYIWGESPDGTKGLCDVVTLLQSLGAAWHAGTDASRSCRRRLVTTASGPVSSRDRRHPDPLPNGLELSRHERQLASIKPLSTEQETPDQWGFSPGSPSSQAGVTRESDLFGKLVGTGQSWDEAEELGVHATP